MASHPHALADVLRGALASLRDIVPYDLAAVYELSEDRLVLRVARGPLADERLAHHELPLARFPTIRRALELRRPIPLEATDHEGEEGDPYDGLLDLPPGHSCMVVPLFASDRTLGIITLDRSVCAPYPADMVQLAGVYGQIVSIAMLFAQQAQLLSRYRHQLREEKRLLEEEVGGTDWAIRQLEGSRSPQMAELVRMAKQVAQSQLPVLVGGETGTGKEVLAQAIHAWSPRAEGPFIKLNCAAIPENLVESELFGHVKGAFSGASAARRGRFLTANGGSILLDEVGDMPLGAQAKLLRVLQEGMFEPLGSDDTIRVDVRVIAATHTDLREAVRRGTFREDLYYRLAGFPIQLPALRDRVEDLGGISSETLARLASRTGRGPWVLSAAALDRLVQHVWPGNVRELVNVLERATILTPSGKIEAQHISVAPGTLSEPSPAPSHNALPTFQQMQRQYFTSVLERSKGRIYGEDGAAEIVGLKPTTLQSRLKKLGINPAKLR